jgi:hypothetical protein
MISDGGVAQSVEQTAHIRYVGGSIPSAAIFSPWRGWDAARENNEPHETYIPGI